MEPIISGHNLPSAMEHLVVGMNKKRILIRLGKGLLGANVALVSMLQKMFAVALTEDEKDERRLHDSELIGTYNHRTARLDAGTDPYGWYDDD